MKKTAKISPKMTYNFTYFDEDSSLISTDNFIGLTHKKENKRNKIEIYKKKNKNTLF